jgi:2-dehydro-3-deoxyphosphogluconate aldolase / (4S)-4-hydroxy-2-oxoglutarate aldolase
MLPGAITPTEVVAAWDAGAACVKLFPGSLVGPDYLKALRGPLPDIPLMPTGGVSAENLGQWFAAGAVAVGMGGNLAKGSPAEVEAAARATAAALAAVPAKQRGL